ncbi:MAG: GGDEF domain-containing protein [Burkholderiales bacterium]|nr:GGDEF domain-containing protein [Burkholderiales bacterium]
MQRLEPTPANFARAWREEGGDDRPDPVPTAARQTLATLSARLMPAGPARVALADALAAQQWDALERLLHAQPSSPARDAQQWADLIDRLTRHLERGSKLWTTGRKKDSLQRVLTSSRSDIDRLQQRLTQLLAGWDGDTPDAGAPAAPTAAAEPAPCAEPAPAADPAPAAAGRTDDEPAGMTAATSPAPRVEALVMTSPGAVRGLAVPTPAVVELAAAARIDDALPASPAARLRTEDPAATATTGLLAQAVALLHESVQTALPSDDTRAGEVSRRLRELAGTPEARAQAGEWVHELTQACGEVSRVLVHRHHFVDQLCKLIGELTDSLGEFSEDDSWVRGQTVVMHEALRGEAGAALTVRGVRSVSELLRVTRERQKVLRIERGQARDALRELIRKMLQDLGELGAHTGRYSDNLGRYAQVIGEADTLQGLAGVVREMVDETRAVHGLVSATTRRLEDEHRLATELSARVHTLEDEIRRLSDEVSTDPLTQIANRRGLMRHFEAEQASQQRAGHALAVALLDIDNFKKLNDSLGHQAGDAALQFLSRRVGELLRPNDTLARYGGEEFVVLLPATTTDEAQQALTRLQRLLSAELFMHENRQTFVTFSAGVTLYRPGEALEAALQRADEALYEAKRTGKNRTCIA